MPELPPTAEFDTARDALDDLIRRYAPAIGPQAFDGLGDPTGETIPDVMLNQWVLVCAWIDPADGECYITRANMHAPSYQITGLLAEAMDTD